MFTFPAPSPQAAVNVALKHRCVFPASGEKRLKITFRENGVMSNLTSRIAVGEQQQKGDQP